MTARPWLIISIGLNCFLAAGLLVAIRPLEEPEIPTPRIIPSGVVVHTNVVIRSENFTWGQVETTNYLQLFKNLRAIECPERTIEDIILARVNRVYTGRRLNEVVYPNYEWWLSDPDAAVVAAANEKVRSLEGERRDLLNSILGTGWDAENNALVAARGGITLTGPVLGEMSPAAKAAAFGVIAAAEEKIQEYQRMQREQNKPIDPMETVRLREEPILKLASMLTPAQYDEFVLRYSPAAQQLREQMRGVSLSQEQFRDLFNAVGTLLGQPGYYYSGTNADLVKQQQQLATQSDSLIKEILGQDVYAAYQLNQDPLYRSTKTTAQQIGLATNNVMPFYEINRATQAELSRIGSDDSLSDDEKIQALSQTRVEAQQALEQLIGPDAFEKYLQMTAVSAK